MKSSPCTVQTPELRPACLLNILSGIRPNQNFHRRHPAVTSSSSILLCSSMYIHFRRRNVIRHQRIAIMAWMQDKNPFGLLSEPTTPTPSRQRKRRREASTSTSTQLVVSPASSVLIKIYYRVRLPETEGFKYIPRHTAQKDLLQAQEIKSLGKLLWWYRDRITVEVRLLGN